MLDIAALVAEYQADETLTTKVLAEKHGYKPADIAAILRLHGVKLRRGMVGSLTPEARAKGVAVRSHKALVRQMEALLDKYPAADLCKLIVTLDEDRQDNLEA
jgi:hypothetical protein